MTFFHFFSSLARLCSKGKKLLNPLPLVSSLAPVPSSSQWALPCLLYVIVQRLIAAEAACSLILSERTRELKKKKELFDERLVIDLAFSLSFQRTLSPFCLSPSSPNRSSRTLQVAVAGPVFAGARIGMSIAGDVKVREEFFPVWIDCHSPTFFDLNLKKKLKKNSSSRRQGWYNTLKKSKLTPPDSAFGPVWTVLYIMMGISSVQAFKAGARGVPLVLYGAQLAVS